ncbi:MAG: D-amino acid dehydrogenase [Gammaproteobacteria bacterium]
MKVIVLGSGVIGVTAAHYLNRAGHEVTVLDRQPAAAMETSYANAGEISPGYAAPWAAPGVPLRAIRWLLMRHGPLVVRPKADARMWSWIAMMLRNCTAARYAINKRRMVRLAEYSRDCLRALREETGIRYEERTLGTLQVLRTQRQLDAVAADIEVLRQYGVVYELLDRDGCARAEPALAAVREKLAGGLRLPGDETGDCHLFTQKLARLAADRGVQFRHNVAIERLQASGDRVEAVVTSEGSVAAEAYVVALGSYSPPLLRPLGIRLPVYPVKGYSITVPITDPDAAPVSTVMDENYKVAITRLGDRVRVGGTAELAGYDLRLRPSRRAALEFLVEDLFPRAGDVRQASFWCGLRPMTPDGTPVLGPTPLGNLYLSTGHGTLGWTMACGSGRVLADLICGRKPEIETADLAVSRYRD